MIKSEKSAVEIEIQKMIELCDDIIDDNYLKTQDARRIVDLLAKGLSKVEELRISRDKWADKCKKLKKEIKKLKERK